MLTLSLFEILAIFFKDSTITQPNIFGLRDFSHSELASKKYELTGDLHDFHFYEKDYNVRYYQNTLDIVFKLYFYAERDIGSGFSVGPGLRLTSVLKWHRSSLLNTRASEPTMKFYFSEDKEEGAVIFCNSIVLRFNQWDRRGAYTVGTIESDFCESDTLNKLATNSVKQTMQPCLFELTSLSPQPKRNSTAFYRLLRYLSKNGIARSATV